MDPRGLVTVSGGLLLAAYMRNRIVCEEGMVVNTLVIFVEICYLLLYNYHK